jgi:uncharacterized membrane protein (DUF2068 family)
MRRPLADWHAETFVCSFRRHRTPAGGVSHLRPQDAGLGVDLPDGRRLVRCVRCDVWVSTTPPPPGRATADVLPPLADLPLPRRGKPLREAIVIRLIAIDRGVHAVFFAVLAVALILLDANFGPLRSWANGMLTAVQRALSDTEQDPSRDFLVRELQRFLHLGRGTVTLLAGTAVAYAVVEGVEAVGLWRERRWAEYLTAVATAGFLPFEIKALIDRVTVLRLVALVVNVAILLWLIWSKRLFGIRGGYRPHDADIDRAALFGPPASPAQDPGVPSTQVPR